jgi:hypothetical protein
VLLLVLILVAVVFGLVRYQAFSHAISSSNARVQHSARRALSAPRDVMSHNQILLITFQGANVFVRTDPHHELISLLSLPSSAYAPYGDSGHETLATADATAGSAGVIHFARSALGLRTSHVALVEPKQLPALVDAVGGIRIYDRVASNRPGGELELNGVHAARYIANAGLTDDKQRERALLDAIVMRLMSVSSFSRLTRLARTLPKMIDTDLTSKDAIALALFRLRVRHLVECGTPAASSLASPGSKAVLRRFLGESQVEGQFGSVVPDSGCRARNVPWAGVPASIVSIGSATLSVVRLLPAVAVVVIVLDAIFLIIVLRIPRAVVAFAQAISVNRTERVSKPRPHRSRSFVARSRHAFSSSVVRTQRVSSRRIAFVRTHRTPRRRTHRPRIRRRLRSTLSFPNLRWGIGAAMLGIVVGYAVSAHL